MGFVVAIAHAVKTFQILRFFQAVSNDEIRHGSSGLFGKKADNFVLSLFQVLEYGSDDLGLKLVFEDGLEILIGSQIDEGGLARVSNRLVEFLGDEITPESVEVVTSLFCREVPFVADRLDEIQRLQQTVETGKNAKVLCAKA